MPKTIKEQKTENKQKFKGAVSIKISKPKLTINGFVVEKQEPKELHKNSTKSMSKKSEKSDVRRSSRSGSAMNKSGSNLNRDISNVS